MGLGRFPSGQRGQTVNLLAQPSKVRILLSPKAFRFMARRLFRFPDAGADVERCRERYTGLGSKSSQPRPVSGARAYRERELVQASQERPASTMGIFYENGLQFSCTRCSACCRHTPGYVFLSRNDLSALVVYLRTTEDALKNAYCRQVVFGQVRRLSLKEKKNLDCVFWEEGGCTVYPARPLQCRSFPFWASSMASMEEWERCAKTCPGVGKGELHSRSVIEGWLRARREEGYLEE
jgi:Fe-S-cluster containining protein